MTITVHADKQPSPIRHVVCEHTEMADGFCYAMSENDGRELTASRSMHIRVRLRCTSNRGCDA